nr:glutathione s-transferase t3 [Quercus suber]
MDSRNYSSFTDLVRGNINLEDELFDVSESSPLIVEDSPMNDEVATSKKKPARGVNFSVEEDKLLVVAWLSTSVDPVYGNKQHKTTFYGKVAKYFTNHKTDSTRRVASLTTRWETINRETVKFVGSLAKIEAKNESGTTAHDKDFPKWASTMLREDSRKEMPQTPNSIDRLNGIMDFERPIGRKAKKANRKRKNDGKDIAMEYLKKKMKILEEGCAAEKEKVRIKAEKVRLQELKENERIMMLDTSGMNEDQRTFYDGLKKEILAKQRSSHSLG